MDRVRENDEDEGGGVAEPLPLREALAPSPVDGVVEGGRDETGAGDRA